MAGVVVARAFWDRMRFSLAAANRLIEKEELSTIEDLRELDSKRCERIVGKLIKPGGTDNAGDPNYGVEVSDRAQTNFCIAVHRAVMWERCQRPYVLSDIEIDDDFEMAKHQLAMEEKHVDQPSLVTPYEDKQLKDRDYIQFAEELVKLFNKFRHTSGVVIGFVLRLNLIPEAHNLDPEDRYTTHDDEAFARARIIKAAFEARPADQQEEQKNAMWTQIAKECNGLCYDYLHVMLGPTRYWTHVTAKMQRDRDGRGVYFAIRRNVCGPTANSDLCRSNRAIADSAYWNGDKRKRKFKDFIDELRRCRKVQDGLALVNRDAFHAFTEDEMVTFLRRGTRGAQAKVAVSTVMATPHLRGNFEEAQLHIQQQIDLEQEQEKLPAPRGIHETNRKGGGRKKGGKNPWDTEEGRWDLDGINSGKYDEHLSKFTCKDYYSHVEWKKLHPMIRRKKYLAKKSRGGRKGAGTDREGGRRGDKRTVAELKAQIAELKKQKKALEEEVASSESDDEDQGTNAGNPALEPHGVTRNKFKKGKGKG